MKNDDGIAFAAGDRVFAKVKGFPPWPARITDIVDQDKNTFYNVEFYGTHESAKLKSSDLCFYLQNKAKFGKPKTKNFKFNKALQEIEQSIAECPNENHLNCEMELFSVDKTDLVNSELEEKVAEHACELHSMYGQLIDRYGSNDFINILQVTTNILEEYNDTVITNNLLKAQNEELETKCTDIEKALQKEKSLRLEELELSVCLEADVEVDVKKHKDIIKALTRDLSSYIEDVKHKNNTINELNESITILNSEVSQLRKENCILNNRIDQLKEIADKEKINFSSEINNFKSLETALKLQITQFEQQLNNSNKNFNNKNYNLGLHENDVNFNLCNTLLANEWILDDSISLYFDFLLQSNVMKNVYFMSPNISQGIKCTNDIDCFLEPEMISKSYIFIPINDSKGAMEVNGSHWSLLFYSRADEAFYYIESIKNYNLSHAQVVFTKLEPYMCSSGPCSFNVVNSPQQRNGIECGIYLLIFVEWLVRGISARTEYETFDVEAYFGDLEVRDSDIIRKRAIMTYLTYNKQYKELKEEIAKELIFNISGKGDLETNQSKEKINIHERQPSHETCKITEEQVSAAKNTKCQQEFEDSLSFISGMEKWSVVKRKSMQGRFNHRCSLMQDKTTSQTVTANKYSILDRLSEICKKENESYDKNHCIKNHIKKNNIGTDKSYSGKSKTGMKSTTFKFKFKMKVNLCSDSQGSLLSSKLEELSNGKVNCFGYVRANTTLTQVADSASLWDDTSPVILLGGSNDSLNGNFQNIYSNLELKLHHLSKTRPVFITTVPIRYDKDLSSAENNDLRLVNSYITELTNRLDDVFLINLNGFKRFHYTAHGLHLNNRGKSKLAYVILNALSWWQSRNKSGNLEKITTTNSKPENHAQDFEQMSEFPRLPTAKNFRRVQMEETAADGSSTQDDLTLQLPQVSSISVESQSLLSNGVNDGRLDERLLQLLHNVEGDDSDDEPVDDSDEDPNYVVSDNELNQSESDDSFAVDEPQLNDEDDIHYSVKNYLV
ncbi:hypothetical protein J6590_010718 [Homalodisca vitripennis]|nr:hypothetical protein J6590_010718 [Homalodisca vitripennis]